MLYYSVDPVRLLVQYLVCVVCVSFPFILDIKFVGRTSRGHTGFLIHLLSAVRALFFLARRIPPFLSLVDREVEFCVLLLLFKKNLNASKPSEHPPQVEECLKV